MEKTLSAAAEDGWTSRARLHASAQRRLNIPPIMLLVVSRGPTLKK